MRFSNAVLGTVCGLMSFFWGVVWLNNIYLSWIKLVWMKDEEIALTINGFHPWIDLFCIDHSTVSSFIPFFSLFWLTLTFYQIGRWAKVEETIILKKEFPYFAGYNEWVVALGLMGTVWGLIMIGYLPNLENLKITGLIGALRTALFSTLVALIWVYIIVLRIIRPGMQWFAGKCLGQSEPSLSGTPLETAIEQFAENLEKLNSVLVDSTKIIDEFRKMVTVKNLDEAEKFFKTCTETLPVIKESCKQQSVKLEELTIIVNGQLSVMNRNTAYFKTQTEYNEKQSHSLASISKLFNQKDARDARNRRRFRRILDAFKGYGEDEIK